VAREHTWRAEVAQSSASPRQHLPPPPPPTLLVYSPSATINHHATARRRCRLTSPQARALKQASQAKRKQRISASEIKSIASTSRVLSKKFGFLHGLISGAI